MEAKEIYDVNSLATVQSGYHMQLDKTLRIFFQCCQDFPEISLRKHPHNKYVTRVTK